MKCSNCRPNSIVSCTVNRMGEHHSFNGKPSIVWKELKEWHQNGKHHRENNQPAADYFDGSKHWYIDGNLHRDQGPAVENSNGYKSYWLNGKTAIEIPKQELYIGKVIETPKQELYVEEADKIIQIENQIVIVLRQINNLFWEVLHGDKKRLVVNSI